jgi:hypothetical protein
MGTETVMPHSDKDIPSPPVAAPRVDSEWASTLKSIHEENVDDKRLQQLGYDAVLGRDYTFWSSLAISWMNIGSIQGSIAAVRGAYNYGGPLMIVGRARVLLITVGNVAAVGLLDDIFDPVAGRTGIGLSRFRGHGELGVENGARGRGRGAMVGMAHGR